MRNKLFYRRMKNRREPGRLGALGTLALASLLAGCTVGPKYHQPVAIANQPVPPVYKEIPRPAPVPVGEDTAPASTQWVPAQPSDAMLRGKWWEIYNDPELNALEERLNIDNQTIKQFFYNFIEARAIVREARAQLFPTVTTSPAWSRSRTSANLGNTFAGQNAPTRGETSNFTTIPINISWEPDLFGRIRNQIHEEQYAAQVSAADLENERLAEQASLAEYFFDIRTQDALQRILNDTVEADKKALDLTRSLYETGIDNQISVVQAQSTLESVQAQATNVGLLRAQYEHAIAVLIGKPASDFSIPVLPRTPNPPPIPIGVPSQLLERRPDIAAAERNMASANAAIGVAVSAFYPTVTLSVGGGFESNTWKHLFDWPSRFWSLGPTISQPLYSAQLGPGVSQFNATYNADVAAYRQTILTAFQQVEDNLTAVSTLSRQVTQQEAAVKSAQAALDLEMVRYQTGIDPYIDVVTLQTTLLTDQQAVITLRQQEMTDSVALIEALGGGWDASQLPTPKDVTQAPPKADNQIVR